MTDSRNRARVERAMNALRPYLASYVNGRLSGVSRGRRPSKQDTAAYVSAIIENWDIAFARELPATARSYVFELKDIRNRWAHEEEFDDDEARRAIDTIQLVAKAIGAPTEILNTFHETSAVVASGVQGKTTSSAPPHGRNASTDHTPRVDASGAIVNANELTASDVAMKRVLCPACEKKVFETWPGGWDAHAAHTCRGVTGATQELRKADFRRRFSHLFRGDGLVAQPKSQREAMRQVWATHGPDEDRVIREYAAAEKRGDVARSRNKYNLSPEDYARALLNDGLRKGWLK